MHVCMYIYDPSQIRITFHFFPKSSVSRKHLEVVKYEFRNSKILMVCDVNTSI